MQNEKSKSRRSITGQTIDSIKRAKNTTKEYLFKEEHVNTVLEVLQNEGIEVRVRQSDYYWEVIYEC